MQIENLEQLPMTELETALKHILNQRPDIKSKILSAKELSDYIAWMAENFGEQFSLTIDSIPSFTATADIKELGRKIIAQPGDRQALNQLAAGFTNQQEERYIAGGHDISVFRMFRYMPPHWHTNTYFEIYYSFSGDCPVYFQDEVVTVKPGTVLIVAPSAVHASPCYGDDCCLLYCMVRTSTFDEVFWKQLPAESLMATFFRRALDGGQPTSYVQFDTGSDEDIRRLIWDVYKEYQLGEAYSSQMLNALMSAFFIMMFRRYEGTARLPRTENFYWKHEFSAIFSFIQAHYTDTSLPEISARFHYSERQISRIVLNNTGLNYAQLIVKLRMEKAANLLRLHTLPMHDIAAAVGYSTLSSFYRTFTKYYGCTPATYLQTVEAEES